MWELPQPFQTAAADDDRALSAAQAYRHLSSTTPANLGDFLPKTTHFSFCLCKILILHVASLTIHSNVTARHKRQIHSFTWQDRHSKGQFLLSVFPIPSSTISPNISLLAPISNLTSCISWHFCFLLLWWSTAIAPWMANHTLHWLFSLHETELFSYCSSTICFSLLAVILCEISFFLFFI